MEATAQTTVEELCSSNPRFRMLYEEHLILEKELIGFEEKVYLTPDEEVERKKVQKLKLAGKDEMERILGTLREE
jgi:uncharacterized protein YdcH (DUF465 family)